MRGDNKTETKLYYIIEGGGAMEIEGYDMQEELYYEENHFWLREEGDFFVMGLDDFGQKMAGDIVFGFPVETTDGVKVADVGWLTREQFSAAKNKISS